MTWQKTEENYSPLTMNRDYAENNHKILRFARETQDYEFGTRPYLFLGPATYQSHEGERPVSFIWKLDHPLPADFQQAATLLAG